MARIARIAAAVGALAFVLGSAPSANAEVRQLICRNDRVIYTSDFTIRYPWFEICR